jgi:hypothetical protein
MIKIPAMIAFSAIVLSLTISILPAQDYHNSQEQTEWIAKSLKEMKKIKVGMIRADLLKVFVTEGGISTPLNRTYVYRECPYIKVDVEFEPLGSRDVEGRGTSETNEDVIKKISKPYLEWSVTD